jgi:lipid-A-disaccharide synthase
MAKSKSDIFIICGEKSGDNHGSFLVKELLKKNPSLKIHCWGGNMMKEAGAEILENYNSYSVMGFLEVLQKLRFLVKKLNKCKRHILELNPKIILLIDFPGFNLRIAKFSKMNGFNVHYYIPPKAWAWNKNRAKILSSYTDMIYSILPFEVSFFKKYNCRIKYVGNPIYKQVANLLKNKKSSKKIISLLPGSRESEIKYSIPIFKMLCKKLSKYNFIVCAVNNINREYYLNIQELENVEIVFEDTLNIVSSSQLSIVMSGTASLEVVYLNIPHMVVYKTSKLSYYIAKLLVNIKYFSLTNLILNKKVVNEFIQDDFNTVNLISEIKRLNRSEVILELENDYLKIKKTIGLKNSSKEVTEYLLKSL